MDNHINSELAFSYTCFDRSIFRGYLHSLFPVGGVVNYYKSLNINTLNKDTLKIPTNELVGHIENYANQHNIPIEWWNSVDWKDKTDGGKSAYVEEKYLKDYKEFDNKVFTIISTMEKTYTIENSKKQSSKTLYRVQKQDLRKEGIDYKMEGNCFTQVENPVRLQELGKQITGDVVLQRCEYWKSLFFKFNKGSYSKSNPNLQHQYFDYRSVTMAAVRK